MLYRVKSGLSVPFGLREKNLNSARDSQNCTQKAINIYCPEKVLDWMRFAIVLESYMISVMQSLLV